MTEKLHNTPRQTLLLACLIGLSSILAFLPSLEGGYVYDDAHLVAGNRMIQSWDHASQWFQGDLFDVPVNFGEQAKRHMFYRPLVTASYALDWFWGGGASWAFHVTNQLWHLLASILVFLAVRRWLRDDLKAGVVALIFALHPSKVESVAWISGRPDSMAAALMLLGLWLVARSERWQNRSLSLVCCCAALLCKETAIVVPVWWMFEDWLRDRRSRRGTRSWWSLTARALPVWCVCGGYLLARSLWLPLGAGSSSLGLVDALGMSVEAMGRFVSLAVFPRDISMFWATVRFEAGRVVFSPFYVALGCACYALLPTLAVLLLRRRGAGLSLGFWLVALAFATLSPALHLIPSGARVITQGRYLYLALVPLTAAVVAPLPLRGWGLRVVAVVAALFGLLSWTHSKQYLNNEVYWRTELSLHPEVSDVVYEAVLHDLQQVGAQLTVRRAVCGFDLDQRHYRGTNALALLRETMRVGFGVIADGDTQLLDGANFLEDVRNGRSGKYDGVFHLEVLRDSHIAHAIRDNPQKWLLIEASLRARVGELGRAESLLYRVVEACPRCEVERVAAAQQMVLLGKLDAARELLTGLPESYSASLLQFAGLVQQAQRNPGFVGAMFWAHVGRQIDDAFIGYRALRPYVDAALISPDQELLSSVALICAGAGDTTCLSKVFARLSRSKRDELGALGVTAPKISQDAPFVPGTCALASEIR